MSTFYDELEFPQRAEYLNEYNNYKVEISHWKNLCIQVGKQFRTVFQTRSAAVILLHGPMGSGKSLFCKRLFEDFQRTKGDSSKEIAPQYKPDLSSNLWHAMIASAEPSEEQIREVTRSSRVLQVSAGELGKLRDTGVESEIRVRVVLLDDAHKDSIVRPWTDLEAAEFYEAKQRGPDALLGRVAQDIDTACRSKMRRSVIIMCSNDRKWLEDLKGHLDRCFDGLAELIEMPVPQPEAVERIVRTNTNRLNKVSYWYCVDAAKPEKRRNVRQTLMDRDKGFTNSFHAVSNSLAGDARRSGPPRDRNVLTLVTLGAKCAAVQEFLDEREIIAQPLHVGSLHHLGAWEMRDAWASKIGENRRAARMLESEFMLQWVSLDMTATYALLQPPGTTSLGDELWKIVTRHPFENDLAQWKQTCLDVSTKLDNQPYSPQDIQLLTKEFERMGQNRSTVYEPALRVRAGGDYGKGFACFRSVRPDFIVRRTVDSVEYGEYSACEMTTASPKSDADRDIDKAIADALLRTGHVIEFTAFLGDKLENLDKYLHGKIQTYVNLLESV